MFFCFAYGHKLHVLFFFGYPVKYPNAGKLQPLLRYRIHQSYYLQAADHIKSACRKT